MTTLPHNNYTRLPIQRAFVLQLYDRADAAPDTFCGRIEHGTSGKTLRFHNWQELQTFITQLVGLQHNTIEDQGTHNV